MELSPLAIYALIFGCFVANYALRFVPLAIMSRINIPRPFMRWLSYMPVAVMGALMTVEIILPALDAALFPGSIPAGTELPLAHIPFYLNPGIYGAIVSMLLFHYSRSFIGATVAGIAVFALMSHFV